MKIRVFGTEATLTVDGWSHPDKELEEELNAGYGVKEEPGDIRYYPTPQNVALQRLRDGGVPYLVLTEDLTKKGDGVIH